MGNCMSDMSDPKPPPPGPEPVVPRCEKCHVRLYTDMNGEFPWDPEDDDWLCPKCDAQFHARLGQASMR